MKKLFDYFQGKDSIYNMKKIKEEHKQKMKNEQKIHEMKKKMNLMKMEKIKKIKTLV